MRLKENTKYYWFSYYYYLALTAVESKIPDVSNLVKRTDCKTKISELEKKLTDRNHVKYIILLQNLLS